MKNNLETRTLGEVCNLMTGGTPSRNNLEYFNGGEIKWLVSGDIHKKEVFDCDGRITQAGFDNSNAKFLPIDSVLIALNGQGKTRGTVALLRTEATCNQSLVSIYPKDKTQLSSEYLYRVLDGRYDEIRRMTGDTGNERRGLNMLLIRGIRILIPPLAEQKRLVKILNEKFAAIEELKRVTEQQIADAKKLFESRLNEIMTSSSTEMIQGTIADIAEIKGGKRIPKGHKLTTERTNYPYIRVTDFDHSGSVSTNNIRYITAGVFEKIKNYTISDKDVFISIAGTIGISGIVPTELSGANLTENACKLVFKKEINQKYVQYFISSRSFQDQAGLLVRTAAQPKLALTRIKTIHFSYPNDILQQDKIVNELDGLSKKTKELVTILKQKIVDLNELKKSYLEQAFSGKL